MFCGIPALEPAFQQSILYHIKGHFKKIGCNWTEITSSSRITNLCTPANPPTNVFSSHWHLLIFFQIVIVFVVFLLPQWKQWKCSKRRTWAMKRGISLSETCLIGRWSLAVRSCAETLQQWVIHATVGDNRRKSSSYTNADLCFYTRELIKSIWKLENSVNHAANVYRPLLKYTLTYWHYAFIQKNNFRQHMQIKIGLSFFFGSEA